MANKKEKNKSIESGLGKRIKEVRVKNGLGMVEFAKKLGLKSSGFISEAEKGEKIPGGNVLISLKREFGISLDWLVTGQNGEMNGAGITAAVRLCHDKLLDSDYSVEKKAELLTTVASLKARGLSDDEIRALPALGLAAK